MPLKNVHAVNLFIYHRGNPARKSSRHLSDLLGESFSRQGPDTSLLSTVYIFDTFPISVEQRCNFNSDLLRVRPWDNCTSSTFDQVTNNL